MYKIKLADGTLLNNLELNGNNYISEEEIAVTVFENNLSYVEVMDEDGKTTAYNDMVLLKCEKWIDGKTWFIIEEKTEGQKKAEQQEQEKEELLSQVTDLQLALCEQYEENLSLQEEVTNTQLALCELYEGGLA